MARNSTYDRNRKTRDPKPPAFIAYHVAERGKDSSFWTRIGAAWDHEDGKGLTVQLDLVPVGEGRIVLREPREDDEQAQDQGQDTPDEGSAAGEVEEKEAA